MSEFDEEYNMAKRLAMLWLVVMLGLIGFGVWVVVKVLQHFAVI